MFSCLPTPVLSQPRPGTASRSSSVPQYSEHRAPPTRPPATECASGGRNPMNRSLVPPGLMAACSILADPSSLQRRPHTMGRIEGTVAPAERRRRLPGPVRRGGPALAGAAGNQGDRDRQ